MPSGHSQECKKISSSSTINNSYIFLFNLSPKAAGEISTVVQPPGSSCGIVVGRSRLLSRFINNRGESHHRGGETLHGGEKPNTEKGSGSKGPARKYPPHDSAYPQA